MDRYNGISAGFDGIHTNEAYRKVIKMIYERLNVTQSYTDIPSHDNLGLDNDGNVHSELGESLANSSLDISLVPIFLVNIKNIVLSEIFAETGISVMSQNQVKKSIIDQIFDLFGWRLIVITLVLSALTIFMFKISLKMDIGHGFLELTRMWVNSGFLKQPKDTPSRIYLFGIFLYALILLSVFQGKILGFQMHPSSEKNIETMNDLLKLKHGKIYGVRLFMRFLDEKLENRYLPIPSVLSCPKYVLSEKKNTCISAISTLRKQAVEYSLFLPDKVLIKMYVVIPMKKNWPLTKRVNIFLKRFFEHHLINVVNINAIKREGNVSDGDPQTLKMQHCYFVFETLLFGLAFPFVIFVLEILWSSKIFHKLINRS